MTLLWFRYALYSLLWIIYEQLYIVVACQICFAYSLEAVWNGRDRIKSIRIIRFSRLILWFLPRCLPRYLEFVIMADVSSIYLHHVIFGVSINFMSFYNTYVILYIEKVWLMEICFRSKRFNGAIFFEALACWFSKTYK